MSEKVILAVSGGVDSIVMLDMVVNGRLDFAEGTEFVVAHFDHGIRDDSAEDYEFVKGLAKEYGLEFEVAREELGADCSESEARLRRYEFLNSVKSKIGAHAIATAHHKDDLLETAAINILRGTGWRGLASLDSSDDLIRPMLDLSKKQILDYARENDLKWREDSTNSDQSYLRNRVRRELLPKLRSRGKDIDGNLFRLIDTTRELKRQIDDELGCIITSWTQGLDSSSELKIKRYNLVMVSDEVGREIVYKLVRTLQPEWHPTRQHLVRALHFIRSGQAGKRLELGRGLILQISNDGNEVIFRLEV